MSTFRHANQLIQLRKLNPPAAARATSLYNRGLWGTAAKIVTTGLKEVLARQNDPAEMLWRAILANIKAQKFPVGKNIAIGEYRGRMAYLFRRRDDKIVLYSNGRSSKPIAMLVSDLSHISGPRSRWALVDEARAYNEGDARRAFEEWVRQ